MGEGILLKIAENDMKILFTDLDDTLLNNQSEVSEYTKEVILRMLECGHRLVL